MKIKWERDRGVLTIENEIIVVSNIVRNELNGWRHANEVVMTVPSGVDIAMP